MKIANRLLLTVVTLVFAAGVQARNAPIVNPEKIAVTTSSGKAVSAEDVRKAIVVAGTSKGWAISNAGDGKTLRATLVVRVHTVAADIEYSATEYSIRYKDSVNMDYKDGTIHPNYNRWIQNLVTAIRTELARF